MPEKIIPGPIQDTACICEAVCIYTKKIHDSYRDKDCIGDLRFYPTQNCQAVIDHAISIEAGKAELLYVHIDVEPIDFNQGSCTMDVCYCYRVAADALTGAVQPAEVCGLCVFDKRVILFGSEGTVKVLSSETAFEGVDEQDIGKTNLPIAMVETVDPIVLNIKLVDVCECCLCDYELIEIPPCIYTCFGRDLCFGNDGKRIYVTLGRSSIIRLERGSQLLMLVYDYYMLKKECTCGGCGDDPYEVFCHVKLLVNGFFLPNSPVPIPEIYQELKGCCGWTEAGPLERFRGPTQPVGKSFPTGCRTF